MKFNLNRFVHSLAATTMAVLLPYVLAHGDEPEREGPWKLQRTESTLMFTAEMTLQGAAEPKPALKHRLVPDAFDLQPGNSAIYYLKAMAFLEQTSSAKKLQEYRDKNRELANAQGTTIDKQPPYSWEEMTPQELPLAEVKEYLSYTAFQPPLVAEATLRTEFSLDRNIRQVESPIAYLLPEIQAIRELARLQSLRYRVAIAEHRIADAVTILQQQFTMARHLGSDEFIVSNLVGAAVSGIASRDMLYLLQEPDAPNLYWALASLPAPLIDMSRALPVERNFLVMQLKALQDVDETLRPAGYWQDFVDRIWPQIKTLDLQRGLQSKWIGNDPQAERAAFVTSIAAAYPGAKRFLIEECQIDQAKVDAYSTAQVVFLAMKLFNQQSVDDTFKWFNLPFDQILQNPEYKRLSETQAARSQRVGWVTLPSTELLSSIQSIHAAQMRVQQLSGLIQTIEAMRMYGALNAGKLPPTLADLPYPVPNDPYTGKPFQYELSGDQALLSGKPLPYIQYRFQLRFAK